MGFVSGFWVIFRVVCFCIGWRGLFKAEEGIIYRGRKVRSFGFVGSVFFLFLN